MIEIFSLEEIKKLNSIFKLIMPAGQTGMPEAEFVLNKIDLENPIHCKFVELSRVICNKIALNQFNTIEDLNIFKKSNFRDFSVFVNMLFLLYYSDKMVLSKLGVGSVPPFPEGNFVKEGDLYLLEQVFIREKIYKD